VPIPTRNSYLEESLEEFSDRFHDLDLETDHNVSSLQKDQLRNDINQRLRNRPDGLVPSDEGIQYLNTQFANTEYFVALYRFGQKLDIDTHVEYLATLVNAKNSGLRVDVALALEVKKDNCFLSLARDPQTVSKNMYSLLKSNVVGNLLIGSHWQAIPHSYRVIIYNNWQHAKKNIEYSIRMGSSTKLVAAIGATALSVISNVESVALPKIEQNNALRFEVYFNLNVCSIDLMKSQITDRLCSKLTIMSAKAEEVKATILSMGAVLREAVEEFSSDKFSFAHSLLLIYHQYVSAVFCLDRMNREFLSSNQGLGWQYLITIWKIGEYQQQDY
jgi:hypothetical protein